MNVRFNRPVRPGDAITLRAILADRENDARDVDLTIAAVFEAINVKQDEFRNLDEVLQLNAIPASNIAALTATPLASVTNNEFMIIRFHRPTTGYEAYRDSKDDPDKR